MDLTYGYAFLLGYLLGAIPTAYWLGLAIYRINIFEHGSRNMGATNVHRVLGKGPFAATLTCDILKGMLPVLLAPRLAPSPAMIVPLQLVAGVAAVIGHTLSFWVGFRGGKGVATGLGVFLGLAPKSSILAMVVFLAVLVTTRYVSLGSMLAAAALPAAIYFFQEGGPEWYLVFTVFAAVVAGFIIFKHRTNIRRLVRGEELALGAGAPAAPATPATTLDDA
ncbi:MAG: Acyl-phosphate:glycerol-3-phosphate O-acyltransferase PlsY [Candidatus Ozemobacter sibiricus]|jgi:glycerol-3-phosphate acyltransferase PlsY|uniref:Glycerol-3-phosphate acyltransferase n=1 Tax=Candidatus Ozemobacter sibiricus TaxID=2268124 RepID=A0A367ZVF3_9BACT|nr:MAG: Acyl-phosphate:glycerol-3-phosphate O-acyltransferase PlsY [Candidatus Ozemobacter sibiricus]